MLLKNLLHGKEASNLIILQDSIEVTARPLLISFVKALLDRVDLVCFVCFELPLDDLLRSFSAELTSRIEGIDAYSDYLNWNNSSQSDTKDSQVYHDTDIVAAIKRRIKKRAALKQKDEPLKVAVVIDSLSKLVHRSVSHTCRVLHQLLQRKDDKNIGYEIEQIACIIHADLHDSQHSLYALNSIATSVLHISPLQQTKTDLGQGIQEEEIENYCKILHIRKTGRVLKKKQRFIISQRHELTEFLEEAWTQSTEPSDKSEQTHMVDPTADLPFNLKLTKQAEETRANTQLPYMYHTQLGMAATPPVKDSQIFYQPDDADDFDEDDPDDDLDI